MAPPKSLKKAGKSPEVGQWYRLLSDFGNGVGMLKKSRRYRNRRGEEIADNPRQLLVLDIVEPGTAGVGYSAEQTVLCLWLDQAGAGRLTPRHLSLPASQFVELVTDGSEPPEYPDWQEQTNGEGTA